MAERKRKDHINYSDVFDQVMREVDGNIDQALQRMIESYSDVWELDAESANDMIQDKSLSAKVMLDHLTLLMEIDEKTADFRRAVFVLMAKVKQHDVEKQQAKEPFVDDFKEDLDSD